MKNRIMAAVAVALLLGAGVAAACTSDTDDLEERLDAVEAQLSDMDGGGESHTDNAAILGALLALRGAGLHAIDEMSNDEGAIPDNAAGSVTFALVGMNSVAEWPEDLAGDAENLITLLEELSTALESEDAETVAEPAREAHEAWHNFDHDAGAVIGGGHDEGGEHEEGEEEMEMETPEDEG